MQFGRNILPVVNTHRLTDTDFRFDVTLSGDHDVISRRKVPPPGE